MENKIFLAISPLLLDLDGSLVCNDIIATHSTTEEVASCIDNSMMLLYENNTLVKAINTGKKFSKRKIKEITLPTGFENVRYTEIQNYPFNMRVASKDSISYLGGNKPDELIMPNFGVVSFQYLGFISENEQIFKGKGWNLDLIFPIYSNVEKVFIDYSDPLRPSVLNTAELEKATTSHDDYINSHTKIDYLKKKIEFYKPVNKIQRRVFDSSSLAGIPNWIQNAYIPHCPKSGNRMDFLMQIGPILASATSIIKSNIKLPNAEGVAPISKNEQIDVDYIENLKKNYYEKMNFWGDGTLYIFFEPETKVVCYFIQNT
jgi:hypothetical protein